MGLTYQIKRYIIKAQQELILEADAKKDEPQNWKGFSILCAVIFIIFLFAMYVSLGE